MHYLVSLCVINVTMADCNDAQDCLTGAPGLYGDIGPGAQRALDMYQCLTDTTPTRVCVTVISGVPVAKKRPRFTRTGHAYHDPDDKAAEERTAWHLRAMIHGQPFMSNVAVVCIFYRPDRRRVDSDNLQKHVLDSANKIVFSDDSQVTASLGIIEFDKANPRTVVLIGEHVSTMKRGTAA